MWHFTGGYLHSINCTRLIKKYRGWTKTFQHRDSKHSGVLGPEIPPVSAYAVQIQTPEFEKSIF